MAVIFIAMVVVACLVFIELYIPWHLWTHRKQKEVKWTALKSAVKRLGDIFEKLQPIHRVYNYFTLGMLILYALAIGFLYGRVGYASMPRWLGGGQPSYVILMFAKDKDTSSMPFAVDNSRSPVVKLIAELTDGILIWDEKSQTAVKIKSEVLDGIIGAAPGAKPTVATPTQTATPLTTPGIVASKHP